MGQTLTASPGSWSDPPTSYSYHWQDCTSSNCSNISGATSASYTLQPSDVSDTIDVVVTASNAGGSSGAISAQTATVAADPPPAPANTALPTITGTATEGQTLSASTGTWSNSPVSYSYHWQDCTSSNCSNISGATSASYTLQPSDVSDTIDVVVTASNAGGSSGAISAQTATVAADPPPAPANTALPTITGTATEGQTLTASTGTWSDSPVSYGYQWQDCTGSGCTDICGATGSTYTLQASDVGDTIDVIVAASNPAERRPPPQCRRRPSLPLPPTAARSTTALPAITGTATQGRRPPPRTGTWTNSPTSYTYQWQDCTSSACTNITGATNSSYTLQASDVGDTIDVIVAPPTPAEAQRRLQHRRRPSPPLHPRRPARQRRLPTITGTATQGQTLTATNGTWTDSPTCYSYQWQDCTSSGCTNISGATNSSYTLQSSDVGDTIDLSVGASNAGGSANATSAKTATVAASPPPPPPRPSNTALPTISGTTTQGQTLTASPGTWTNSPTSYGYQWQDCTGSSCSNISGATNATYTLDASDVGDLMDVTVTVTNQGGSTRVSSGQTAVVTSSGAGTSPPGNTSPPLVTDPSQNGGDVIVGQALTSSTGSWTNTPSSYNYQWQRCDMGGTNCVNATGIGATTGTYTADQTDVGQTLRVVVTASNSGGSALATAFQTTEVVGGTPSTVSISKASEDTVTNGGGTGGGGSGGNSWGAMKLKIERASTGDMFAVYSSTGPDDNDNVYHFMRCSNPCTGTWTQLDSGDGGREVPLLLITPNDDVYLITWPGTDPLGLANEVPHLVNEGPLGNGPYTGNVTTIGPKSDFWSGEDHYVSAAVDGLGNLYMMENETSDAGGQPESGYLPHIAWTTGGQGNYTWHTTTAPGVSGADYRYAYSFMLPDLNGDGGVDFVATRDVECTNTAFDGQYGYTSHSGYMFDSVYDWHTVNINASGGPSWTLTQLSRTQATTIVQGSRRTFSRTTPIATATAPCTFSTRTTSTRPNTRLCCVEERRAPEARGRSRRT